jgi:hypothetical protein
VRVTDFGLARSVMTPEAADSPRSRPKPDTNALHVELTATGTVLGTPRYMPPEQLTGPDIDARSDQFSFCIALYEALFGTHPLPGATSVSMLEKGDEAIAPPEGTRVPPQIARAVMRGLQRERSKRFPTMASLVSELVPPVRRSPMRLAATISLAVVVIGGATAAVVTRPDPPKLMPQPADTPEVKLLFDRIRQLEDERKKLLDQIEKARASLEELDRVKKEIVEKDTQIHKLVDQVAQLKARPAASMPKPPPAVTNVSLSTATQAVQGDLEGCFDEWYQRQALAVIEGVQRPRPKEAALLVRMGITPDGTAHDSVASGEQDLQRDGSLREAHGALSFCIETAIARVPFPKGPDALDVEVSVVWMQGAVNSSVRITGRHEAQTRAADF